MAAYRCSSWCSRLSVRGRDVSLDRSLHCEDRESLALTGYSAVGPGCRLDTRQGCVEQGECFVLQRCGCGGECDRGTRRLRRRDDVERHGREMAHEVAEAGDRQAVIAASAPALALCGSRDLEGGHGRCALLLSFSAFVVME